MIRARAAHNGGFTLIEVLIAIAILGVGVAAAVDLLPRSLEQIRMATELNVTSETAASVLGDIRAASARALYNDQIPRNLLEVEREADFINRLVADGVDSTQIDPLLEGLRNLGRIEELYGFNTSVQRLNGGNADGVYLQRVTLTVVLDGDRRQQFTTYLAVK